MILKFERPKVDVEIDKLIWKARLFYLLFFVLYLTAITLDFVMDLSSNSKLKDTLLVINAPIFVLVYILEMIVLKDFVRASLKFIHIMDSVQPMNLLLAKAFIWFFAAVMVVGKFCYCIMISLVKLNIVYFDNQYCSFLRPIASYTSLCIVIAPLLISLVILRFVHFMAVGA